MKPFWITFYSYKGGVGRSLALANTAALLVKRGRRVLLIDFDLEAPGLDSFAEFAPAAGKPGVVEYVSEFLRDDVAPDIKRFVHRCELPGPLRGQLFVMSAGRRGAVYNHQLAHINWAELYESGLGEPFFANWKAAIDRHFQPDYVFVDSRTGLTEIGGVCTTQLPDLVMMLFSLNEQNVEGVASVAQNIREADPDRDPQIHFVATPVPNFPPDLTGDKRDHDRKSPLAERMEAAEKRLGVKVSSTIRYYPPASLTEKLFVFESGLTGQSIHGDYELLCDKIIQFNRTGLDFLINQSCEAIAEGDLTRLDRLNVVLQRDYADRAEAIYMQARFALAKKEIPKALELAERAFERDPSYADAFEFLINHYQRARDYERVGVLFDAVLDPPKSNSSSGLSPERRYKIQHDRGDNFMTLGRYVDARMSYSECMDYASANGEAPAMMLLHAFNLAEATRRAYHRIDQDIWKQVAFFGHAGSSSDAPSSAQASQWQVMHIAFACGGDLSAARDALRKARRAAESVSEIEDVFSVKVYRMVPVSEFLEINDAMLAALNRGELWDGMKLPARAT